MLPLPKVITYGRYQNDNYGLNALKINTPGITIYYSYDTIVAYEDIHDGLVCSKNIWSNTTGKHLNWIQPDKSKRVDYLGFVGLLNSAIERHFK